MFISTALWLSTLLSTLTMVGQCQDPGGGEQIREGRVLGGAGISFSVEAGGAFQQPAALLSPALTLW